MKKPIFLIAGPCAIEDEAIAHQIAATVKQYCEALGIHYIFKGSYKKANRTRLNSYTGMGFQKALEILQSIRETHGVPVLTDVHESQDCAQVAAYVDYLQIPAFLCRQTDLLLAAGETGKGVNIKKGQFMSPEAMEHALEKVRSTGNDQVWLTERGSTFGYDSLVVDMTAIPRMQAFGATVVMDCTHSVQQPNQRSGVTGGHAAYIPTICRAAVAAGCDGLFIETHPEPLIAKSDAASMLRLDRLENLLQEVVRIREALSA